MAPSLLLEAFCSECPFDYLLKSQIVASGILALASFEFVLGGATLVVFVPGCEPFWLLQHRFQPNIKVS